MTDQRIFMIASISQNGAIGHENRIPFNLPGDLSHFRAFTKGHIVILGRKTWESIPVQFRPLPDRINIVLTQDKGFKAEGALIAHAKSYALQLAGERMRGENGQIRNVMIIGGVHVYKEFEAYADHLVITHVHASVAGDRFWQPSWWTWDQGTPLPSVPRRDDEYSYSIIQYSRKSA